MEIYEHVSVRLYNDTYLSPLKALTDKKIPDDII